MAVAQRVYAEALLEASKEKDVLAPARGVRRVRGRARRVRRAARLPPQPAGRDRDEARRARRLLAGAEPDLPQLRSPARGEGRIAEVEEVHEEFGRLLAREERVLELELTTAVELSDKEAAKVVKQIEEASGRSVVATRTVDPDIIGGIVVQAGSVRADASVRGRLDQLREELINR